MFYSQIKALRVKALGITVDIIYPFIVCFVDCVCAEIENCPITTVFMEYVGVMNRACGSNGRKTWTPAGVDDIRRDTQRLNRNGVRVQGLSEIGKWPL